jgi:phosphopantetheinyl transferase (holo-ACP synthase)
LRYFFADFVCACENFVFAQANLCFFTGRDMPLHLTDTIEDVGVVAVWKLTESENELLNVRPLSEQEDRIFSSIKNMKRRKEWLTIRILLTYLTEKNFSISYLPNGKPLLLNPKMFLSISHSENFVAVFISKNKEIGIDIEKIKDNIGLLKNKFLSSEECKLVKDTDNQLLYVYWGAKEAMYKMYSFCSPLFTQHLSVFDIDYQRGMAIGNIKKENLNKTANILFKQIENSMLVCCFEN